MAREPMLCEWCGMLTIRPHLSRLDCVTRLKQHIAGLEERLANYETPALPLPVDVGQSTLFDLEDERPCS